jgi:twitching motility protein PilT
MRDLKTLTLHEMIEVCFDVGASDLFLKVGVEPRMKQYGFIEPLPGEWPVMDEENLLRMFEMVMRTERMKKVYYESADFDLSFVVAGRCRVRANLYKQRGTPAAVMRVVPTRIRTLEELGMPASLREVTKHKQGLVLVTGPTGSGKTTTLAALIDIINIERKTHIVTIEDPLEVEHQDKNSYLSQREVGIDTEDFIPAMRAVVREAPDVILVGEMRDVTTMNAALQAGETGHLVFSTVHTASAYETLDRVINMFPPHEKPYLCQRLSGSLRAVVAQKLIPRADGNGRVVASEILICTPTVSKAIEDGNFGDLYHLMNEGAFWGMQTMNQSLVKYVKAGLITEEIAIYNAGLVSELKQMLRR